MKRLTLFLLLALSCTVLPAQDMTSQLRSMGEKLIEAIQKGRQQEAEGLADKYLALCTKESYRYIGHYYAEARHIKAHSAADRSDFYTALQIMDDVIETRLDKRSPRDDDRLGDSYFDRSTYQESNELAIADLRAASDAYLKAKEGSKYAKTLCILADLYGEAGDAASEAECYEKAYNYADKGTKEYLLAANHMMKVYNEQKKFSKVNALAKALQKTAKKVTEKEPIIYADFLLSASVAEANTGNYAQALEYANEASGLYENEHLFTDHNYAILLKNTADIHFHLQHYQDAIAYYERAKPLLMQAEGRGPSILELYRQLVATYEKLNRPDMVVKITDEMNQLFSTSDTSSDSGSNFGTDANSLAKQAQTLAKYGNYSEAVEIGNKALHLYESRGESRELAIMYNSQSKYYAALRKYQTADSLNTLSLNLSHKKDYTEEEALAYHQKAKLVDRLGKFAQANEACTYATSLLRESGRSSSTTYASILCDQGYYQYKLDSLQNAISLTREALDLKQSILGPDHGENVLLHFHLAEYYRRQGQMDSVAYFYHNAIKLQTELVRNYFSFQNTNERELFWQRQNYPYQAAPSFSIYPDKAPAELLTDLYNAQLFTKGILLNSEIDFRQLLQNSGDQEILAKYEDLQRKREDLQKYYEAESANSDSENRIKQLKQDIEKLERAVVYKCKEYGDFTQNLKLTADSVRRAMHPQEAAVEFLEANINHNGHPDRLYLALILRPEWDAPHACRLFWRSDMEELGYPAGTSVTELLNDTSYLYQDKIYNDCRLGQLVWKNLLQELNGATHIFFAPTGVFYQWGIEYMPINDSGTRISDTLSVSRLSSTKLLAQRSKKTDTFKDGDAVVYGGMDYTGMRIDDMRKYKLGVDEEEEDDDYDAEIEEALQKEAALSDLAANDTEEQSSNTRGAGKVRTFQNLPHAGKEAREIARILKENTDMDVKRYGAFGTEGSFKALSGHDISLLHIATHGFSCTPGKEDAKWLEEINPQTILTSSASDKLLNYSGLVFSGCNNIITSKDKKKFPKDIDDGILTAQEIAQLNLQDLQLTVLSACQTGTGMLQEDGVFGVQRGFKKAGAHTLVMSLWSVSDPVTMLMMTTFYEALRDEPSLSKAFLKAQKAVREQYPRPQDWAPFIMLDDI